MEGRRSDRGQEQCGGHGRHDRLQKAKCRTTGAFIRFEQPPCDLGLRYVCQVHAFRCFRQSPKKDQEVYKNHKKNLQARHQEKRAAPGRAAKTALLIGKTCQLHNKRTCSCCSSRYSARCSMS